MEDNIIEFKIKIDLDLKDLTISQLYDTYTYRLNNLNEVGKIMQSFINEYIKENEI